MEFNIEIAILAGGRSSRFGSNKAMADWFGRPIIQTMLKKVGRVTERIFIIANDPTPYQHLKVPIYADLFPGQGPLSGLHSALVHTRAPSVFLLACDMPLVSPSLLMHMASAAEDNHDKIVTIEAKGRIEPLHTIYPATLKQDAEEVLLSSRDTSITRFICRFHPIVIGESTVRRYCPDLSCIASVNTPEALRRLKRVAQAQQSGFSNPIIRNNPWGKGR